MEHESLNRKVERGRRKREAKKCDHPDPHPLRSGVEQGQVVLGVEGGEVRAEGHSG